MAKAIGKEEVLRLMADGWELAHHSGFDACYIIQKGGAGKGGDVLSVRFDSAQKLRVKGLIEPTPAHEGQAYWLTRFRLATHPRAPVGE